MRILNLNDTHIGGKNSVCRIGNMYDDFMTKLDETIKLSKKCDLVIHSGDVFHTSTVSNSIIDDFLDRVEEAKIPWYILPGNHDMDGAHWNTSGNTSLAHVFRRSKIVQQLDELEFDDIYIKGFPYYHNIENDFKLNGIITESKKSFKIAVTHAFISPKPFRPDVTHVEIKDIKCNFDYVLCSHFHHDTGITEHNSTMFTNCGAWGRRAITENTHDPKVAILTINKGIKCEFIKLKKAKPGSEIFDLTKQEHKDEMNADLDSFINSLRDFKSQTSDLYSVVEMIGKEQRIDREILDLIIKRIGELNDSSKC